MTTTHPGVRAVIPATSRQMITAALLLATALILCGVTLAMPTAPTRAVVWGSVALACYAAGLLVLTAARGHGDLRLGNWKLGPWILLWYGLAFGLATVTWSQPQTSVAAEISVPNVLRALWLIAVSMTCWTAGYLTGPGYPSRRVAGRAVTALGSRLGGTIRSPFSPWILYAIGTAARLASTATTGRFGYVGDASSAVSSATGYGQVLSDLSLLAPLAIAAAALQVYRERLPGARVTLVILFLTELAFGAAAGGKESFVIAVLAVLIPMTAARRCLPKAAVVIGVLFFLAIIIPFNQAYRNVARNGSVTLSPSEAIRQAPAILSQTVDGHSLLTVLPQSVIYLMQRIREIDSPAIILQRSPEQIAFSSPEELLAAPLVAIIPRAIWPGKPILATGYLFSQQYYHLPAALYTSSAITPVGDLYRHGGWVPVIVGMFVLGCGIRLLDDVLDIRTNPHAVFLVLLLFPGLVKAEEDWVTIVASIPVTIVLWVLVVAVTFRPVRPA